MFSVARNAVFDSSVWREQGRDVDFIEAWQYQNVDEACDQNFRCGTLRDHEILTWARDHNSSPPGYTIDKPVLWGKIRLIICERSQYDPLDFPLSRSIFTEVEQVFHLHPATLPTFSSHGGTFSRYLTFYDADPTRLKRVAFILKAPQKREIANYGLSMSHDVESHVTTAVLYGSEVLIRPNPQVEYGPVKQRSHYQDEEQPKSAYAVPALLDLVRSAIQAWHHPLMLPSMLLQHHMSRTRAFTNYGKIVDEALKIERELGVTKVGHHTHPVSSGKGKVLRAKAEELTIRINTHSTRILFTSRSPDWNLKCSEFTLKLLHQLQPYLLDQREAHHELEGLLGFNLGLAEVTADDVASVRERMTLQLSVLYNFVAQMDNTLNAQLAAAAGRDSTSMKILAFISAIFLPGSFVAGVFSMTMFNWQYSGDTTATSGDTNEDGGAGVVSNRFWIYWVIAVPLTLITLFGWGLWWRVEMKRFERNFEAVVNETKKETKAVEKCKTRTESSMARYAEVSKHQKETV